MCAGVKLKPFQIQEHVSDGSFVLVHVPMCLCSDSRANQEPRSWTVNANQVPIQKNHEQQKSVKRVQSCMVVAPAEASFLQQQIAEAGSNPPTSPAHKAAGLFTAEGSGRIIYCMQQS